MSSQVEVVLSSEPHQASCDAHEEDGETGERVGGGDPEERVAQIPHWQVFNSRHVQEEVGGPSLCKHLRITVDLTSLHLKVMKPYGQCDQLVCGEAFKERQSEWEDEVEEGQGGHLPCMTVGIWGTSPPSSQ